MLQQVTIKTKDKATLMPLLESAIENEMKLLSLGLDRTRKRVAEFERKYDMTSTEFERRLNALELTETVEFTDWRMEIGMLQLLEGQYQALEETQVA